MDKNLKRILIGLFIAIFLFVCWSFIQFVFWKYPSRCVFNLDFTCGCFQETWKDTKENNRGRFHQLLKKTLEAGLTYKGKKLEKRALRVQETFEATFNSENTTGLK